jgi:hypothetical protein
MTKPNPAPRARRGKGRPRVPLRQHPDRYAVACYDAMVELFEGKRTGAGFVVMLERISRRSAIISKSLPYPLPEPIVADFNRVADRIRAMARGHADRADLKWRKAISKAIGYAIAAAVAGKDWRECHPFAGQVIVSRADAEGEAEWARRVLLPLMEREPPRDMAERNESLARFMRDPPDDGGDREERILRTVVDFWTLKNPPCPD